MAVKLTPWFPASVNPAHAGPYLVGFRPHGQRRPTPLLFPFHYFDGIEWACRAGGSPDDLLGRLEEDRMSLQQMYRTNSVYWRGLAEEPK